MLKELLNKMKIFKSFCAAIVTGSVYTPYVREAIKAAEEMEKRQTEEKRKRVEIGVMEPFARRFEIDECEVITPERVWNKDNQILFFNNSFEEAARSLAQAMRKTGNAAEEMKKALEKYSEKTWKENRMNTNNWRKMHGLPMRRKARHRKA